MTEFYEQSREFSEIPPEELPISDKIKVNVTNIKFSREGEFLTFEEIDSVRIGILPGQEIGDIIGFRVDFANNRVKIEDASPV